VTADEKKRRRGRPRKKDPVATYKGKSYVVTTFRLNKRTMAEIKVIDEALSLGSHTSALQFAVTQLYARLHELTAGMTREEMDRRMRAELKKYGPMG
jgi:hypothetical protein